MKKNYALISTFYKEDNIFQRHQDYYTQIILKKSERAKPSGQPEKSKSNTNNQLTMSLQPSDIQHQFKNNLIGYGQINSFNDNNFKKQIHYESQNSEVSENQFKKNRNILIQDSYTIQAKEYPNNINHSNSPIPNSNFQKNRISRPNQTAQNLIKLNNPSQNSNDPYLQEAIQQNTYLMEKLQKITFGIDERESQIQLSSNSYILPHYKNLQQTSQNKILGEQHAQIEELTQKILSNQKIINSMKIVRQNLVQKIENIKKLDDQIYKKLQSQREEQVEQYLRTAKIALEQGQSVEKINFILRKILY